MSFFVNLCYNNNRFRGLVQTLDSFVLAFLYGDVMSNGFSTFYNDRIEKQIKRKTLQDLYDKIDFYFNNSKSYGLSYREGQHNMALSVFEAIESKNHLIIEAGVGIGKSYAYLIPLMYFYQMTGHSFVISTSTISLQEQLEKDIKIISQQLDIPINVVIAKGMNNFLCLNRLEGEYSKLIKENNLFTCFNESRQDRKYYPNIADNIWKRVNVEKCSYDKCKNCTNCEFYKTRNLMRFINGVIICNHDLLIEDLSRKSNHSRELIQKVEYIVCDEAHNLENKVRASKTKEIKLNNLDGLIKKAINVLERFNNYDYDLNEIHKNIINLSKYIDGNVFKVLKGLKKRNIDIDDCEGLKFVFDDKILDLSNRLSKTLNNIKDSIEIHSYRDTEEIEEALEEYSELVKILSTGENRNYLFWIERKKNKNHIYCAPKNISDISYKLFFKEHDLLGRNIRTFIFTSATLSVQYNDFQYFMNGIGANLANVDITLEESYESPYDYDKKALLYLCNDIETPKNRDKYLKELTEKIKELILITHGKALVLFTSKKDMNFVYSQIGSRIDDIDIYIQSDGSSQDSIKDKFKKNVNSVLFSTGIFWEGIDIKGYSLSNLIIARLPFPVVNPIMEYKRSLIKDGFVKVYIPEMLIKLKQGVGRLIRNEEDKGIVCLLDSRVEKYEEIIKETLPIKNCVYNIMDVKAFVKDNKIDV